MWQWPFWILTLRPSFLKETFLLRCSHTHQYGRRHLTYFSSSQAHIMRKWTNGGFLYVCCALGTKIQLWCKSIASRIVVLRKYSLHSNKWLQHLISNIFWRLCNICIFFLLSLIESCWPTSCFTTHVLQKSACAQPAEMAQDQCCDAICWHEMLIMRHNVHLAYI